MAYSAITQPDKYMGAYSAVPLKVFDDTYNLNDNFKYIIHICWDEIEITSTTPVILGNDVYTKLTTSTLHNYSLGDYVLLDDTLNNNQYTGYYIIKKIIDGLNFVIDLTEGEPFGVSAFTTSRFIKYKFNPDLNGYAKVDMSNVLKDFVSQNLQGQSVNYKLIYEGDKTRFDYKLICGSEKKYRLEFEDNLFSGGSLCFYNSSITNIDDVPFQVGDSIYVEQDIYGWNYIDNYYVGYYVGFSGSTQVPFRTGTTITITGQQTFPSYNGVTIVDDIPSSNVLQSQKIWLGSTPTEGGVIYGVPRPEYNGVCNIINIIIDPTYGYTIITDKSFTDPSPVIPGYIEFADGRLTTDINQLTITGLSVYNSHLNLKEYTLTEYDKYVIQDRDANLNNISTILNTNQNYRVEPNTIGFVLLHQGEDSVSNGIGYSFYNSSNTLLGNLLFTGITEDTYNPIGLQQISGLTGGNDFGTPFSSYTNDINSYCMFAANDCSCNAICATLVYKPGSGTTNTQCVVKQGLINNRPYFYLDVEYTGTTYTSQLAYLVDAGNPFNDGWYLTEMTGVTDFTLLTGFTWMFDKLNATDCAASQTWSIPAGSPLSGGVNTGTYILSNPDGCITSYSNDICFELNKDCSSYEIYHLMWKDKLGSFISYPFIYISRDNIEAERKNYYKQNGSWENNSFGYKDYERGEVDFYVRSRKSIIVNSGWLFNFERDLMEDLIQSPSVYLQTPDNRLFGGRLEEKKIEVYKQKNDDLFSYSFNFIFSNNEFRF